MISYMTTKDEGIYMTTKDGIYHGPKSNDEYANQLKERIFEATGEYGWVPANDQSALPYVTDEGKEVIDVYNYKASSKFKTYCLTDNKFIK